MRFNSCLMLYKILPIRRTASVYIPQVLFVFVFVCVIIAFHGVSIWTRHMSLSYVVVRIAGESLRNAFGLKPFFRSRLQQRSFR